MRVPIRMTLRGPVFLSILGSILVTGLVASPALGSPPAAQSVSPPYTTGHVYLLSSTFNSKCARTGGIGEPVPPSANLTTGVVAFKICAIASSTFKFLPVFAEAGFTLAFNLSVGGTHRVMANWTSHQLSFRGGPLATYAYMYVIDEANGTVMGAAILNAGC